MKTRAWIATATSIATAVIGMGVVASPASAADTCLDQFTPTSGSYVGGTSGTYTCVVPAGVPAYNIEVRGGYGGMRSGAIGAYGAKLTGRITVTPGSTLSITVGGNGKANPSPAFGASGGGYSAIAQGSTPIVVAAGGGGGGNGSGSSRDGGAAGAGTPGNSTGSDGQTDDEYAQKGIGASNGTGGAGGISNGNYGPGGAGGNTGVAGSPATGGSQNGGGGGGSSYFPVGVTAVNTATDNADAAPRVQITEAFAVSGISPNAGPTTGGTTVTITGAMFADGATVTIGGIPCTPVSFVSSTQLTCTTGAGTAGLQDVVVTNADSEVSTLAGAFTYESSGSATCPITVVNPRAASKKLPVGRTVVLVKAVTTVPQCSPSVFASTRSARGDQKKRLVLKVNKTTGKVTARANRKGVTAQVRAVAVPITAPYTEPSSKFTRTWKS